MSSETDIYGNDSQWVIPGIAMKISIHHPMHQLVSQFIEILASINNFFHSTQEYRFCASYIHIVFP